jgi:diguanylate cyclase
MKLIAAFRERLSVGELSDELGASRARVAMLKDAAVALAACVRALVLDIDELGAARVKGDLDAALAAALAEAPPARVADLMAQSNADLLKFAEAERRYLDEREAELKRIIGLLTDGLAAFGSDNASYHERLLENGARLEAASQLGDIVRMRQAIAREVTDLRSAVSQKRAQDAERVRDLDEQVASLRQDLESARGAAATDALTGAANRAAFESELERRCALAAAGGEGFAVVVVDVDHFKKINDTHGHPVGDRVLMALVAFLRERVRRGDTVARWGGEEFVVLLPGASLRVGMRKARELLTELAERSWSVAADVELSFTVSAGVSAWKKDDTPATLFERADKALYAAKHGGRNRAEKLA